MSGEWLLLLVTKFLQEAGKAFHDIIIGNIKVARNKNSAIGDLHILPWHMNSILCTFRNLRKHKENAVTMRLFALMLRICSLAHFSIMACILPLKSFKKVVNLAIFYNFTTGFFRAF